MAEFEREKLLTFVKNKSGAFPPVFVGRQDLIDEILDQANHAFQRGSASAKNTVVIHGAPGAGKTSLPTKLSQLENEQANHPRVITVTNDEIMAHRSKVIKAIAIAASKPRSKWFAALRTKNRKRQLPLFWCGFRAAYPAARTK